MRAHALAVVAAICLAAQPAFAQTDRAAAAFWKSVQATCNTTAAKPAGALGRRIATAAIGEFDSFGGHRIDANGRLFRFGLTEAEHGADEDGGPTTQLGHLGWWQVMKYWRALYGDSAPKNLEVRGYRDGSTSAQPTQDAALLRGSAADLLHAADGVADPETREMLREAAMRAAVIDTSWSAAFISYVVRQSGVAADTFQFSNAHRTYIYDAFATSAAEQSHASDGHIYRACPVFTTRPRVGDLLCNQREPALAGATDRDVDDLIRTELGGTGPRSVRRTHCEVVAYVDAPSRKVYTIGGNVEQAVTARKLNLNRGLKFSASQKGHCGRGEWNLPRSAGAAPDHSDKCSLNDKKWFVLLQLR